MKFSASDSASPHAVTFRDLLHLFLNDAPQVKNKYNLWFVQNPDGTWSENFGNITYPTNLDVCITYEQVAYSAQRLYFNILRIEDNVRYIDTIYFNGQENQMPLLKPSSEYLPCYNSANPAESDRYTTTTLIADTHIKRIFSPSTLHIVLHDFQFDVTISDFHYFKVVNGIYTEYQPSVQYKVIKRDITGDYKEIVVETVELPETYHDYQYGVRFDLIVDKSSDTKYNYFQYENPVNYDDNPGLGGHLTLMNMTNNPDFREQKDYGFPSWNQSGDVVINTVLFYDLNGSATVEYKATKNDTLSVSIVSDGNVTIRNIYDYDPEATVDYDTGTDYIILPPGTLSNFETTPANPYVFRFNLIAQNLNKYATVKYRFTNADGYDYYHSLSKTERLAWLYHYIGNQEGGHPKPQSEMYPNFPFRTEYHADWETQKYIDPNDPDHGIDLYLDKQYYLIVSAVPLQADVRIIMYIYEPTDGIEVKTNSRPNGFKKSDMRLISTGNPIYKTTDAYTDTSGNPHDESHYYIREWDYDSSGRLEFNVRVNRAYADYLQDKCTGVYFTEGSSLSNPTYHGFSSSEQEATGWTDWFSVAFNPPARGFYKNMQIYIRPVTIVRVKVYFYKNNTEPFGPTDLPPLLKYMDFDNPIDISSGWFDYNDTNVNFQTFKIRVDNSNGCIYNHFSATMIYTFSNGSTESVMATGASGIDSGEAIEVDGFKHAYKMEYTLNIRCSLQKKVSAYILTQDTMPGIYISSNLGGSVNTYYGWIFNATSSGTSSFKAERSPHSGSTDMYTYAWTNVNFESAYLFASVNYNGYPAIYKGLNWWEGNASTPSPTIHSLGNVFIQDGTPGESYTPRTTEIKNNGIRIASSGTTLDLTRISEITLQPVLFEPARISISAVSQNCSLSGLQFHIYKTTSMSVDSTKYAQADYHSSGTEWNSGWWESDAYYPWGSPVFDPGDNLERKFKLTVKVYNRGTLTEVYSYDMNYDSVYEKDDESFYTLPFKELLKISASNDPLFTYMKRSANGMYDVKLCFTIKSMVDGALNITQVKTIGYSDLTDWPDGDNSKYLRWGFGPDTYEFEIKAISTLGYAADPEIHFGTSEDYAAFDSVIRYDLYTDEYADVQMTFKCQYKGTSDGLVGVREKRTLPASYANGNTDGICTVVYPVRFNNTVINITTTRHFKLHPIVHLNQFEQRQYIIEPNVGQTCNITFKHGEQTANNINTTIPEGARRLTKNDFVITIQDGSSADSYLTKGDVTYSGTTATLPLTLSVAVSDTTRFNIQVNNATLMEEAELSNSPSTTLLAETIGIRKITFYEDGEFGHDEDIYWESNSGQPLKLPCVGEDFQLTYGELPLMKVYAYCPQHSSEAIYFGTSHFSKASNPDGWPISPAETGAGGSGFNMTPQYESGHYVYHSALFNYGMFFKSMDINNHLITSYTEVSDVNEYYFYLFADSGFATRLYSMRVYVDAMADLEILNAPSVYLPTTGETYTYKVLHVEVLKPDALGSISNNTYGVPDEHKITTANLGDHITITPTNKVVAIHASTYRVDPGAYDKPYFELTTRVVGSLDGSYWVNTTINASGQRTNASVRISEMMVKSITVDKTWSASGTRILYDGSGTAYLPTIFKKVEYNNLNPKNQLGRISMIVKVPAGATAVNFDFKDYVFINDYSYDLTQISTSPENLWLFTWPNSDTLVSSGDYNLFSKMDSSYYFYYEDNNYRPIVITAGGTSMNFPLQLEPVQYMEYSSSNHTILLQGGSAGYHNFIYFVHNERTGGDSTDIQLPQDESNRVTEEDVFVTKIGSYEQPGDVMGSDVVSIGINYNGSSVMLDVVARNVGQQGYLQVGSYYLFVTKFSNFLRYTLVVQ